MIKKIPLIIAIALTTLLLQAQNKAKNDAVSSPSANGLSDEDLSAYKKQAAQMVSFMEYAFNTLGSSKSEYKDKDIIINQSFLKFFKDAKVQIEDDLVNNRDVVTNKDVQAYLKDIDFFYKEVTFKFTIEEITQETNENGGIYLKVKTMRNLKGTKIDGTQVNENKPRFIEINLDESKKELKIVSIYTTRSGEEQELLTWWNALDGPWRAYFSSNAMLFDTIPLSSVTGAGSGYLLVQHSTDADMSAETNAADTVKTDISALLNEIRRILRTEQIDVSGNTKIYDLAPLGGLPGLRHLNLSKTPVNSLDPIRNLAKLETLKASGTAISAIVSLQYCTNLRLLDLSGTYVQDIATLANLVALEKLDLSATQVADLLPLSALPALSELDISRSAVKFLDGLPSGDALHVLNLSGTAVTSLEPISKLSGLQRLLLDKTYVSNLDPLASLQNLEFINIENTPVADISPLSGIKNLKSIYCDKSMVGRDQAVGFMKKRPGVMIIYESEALTAWWQTMPAPWKLVFNAFKSLDNPPSREQLHELTTIKDLSVAGNMAIDGLQPLRKLTGLEHLDASGTSVSEIMPLKDLLNLQSLKLASCPIIDLSPLQGLQNLEDLDISHTKVVSILPLRNLRNLRHLNAGNSAFESLQPLLGLSRLELFYAENTTDIDAFVMQLWDSVPDVQVIYRTEALITWWNMLEPQWKQLFYSVVPSSGMPSPEQLHQMGALRLLDVSTAKETSNLNPLKALLRLESLNISGLPVADLAPLSSLTRLHILNCSDTPVSDIAPLASCQKIEEFTMANIQVNNLDVIENFIGLKILDISGTKITRLNAVASCTLLTELDCHNTRVGNIKPLLGLKSLRKLKIYNTKVSSKTIDKFRAERPEVEITYY